MCVVRRTFSHLLLVEKEKKRTIEEIMKQVATPAAITHVQCIHPRERTSHICRARVVPSSICYGTASSCLYTSHYPRL